MCHRTMRGLSATVELVSRGYDVITGDIRACAKCTSGFFRGRVRALMPYIVFWANKPLVYRWHRTLIS